MTTYEIRKDEAGNDLLFKIEENGKEWSVPIDPANSDYQRYLNPEAEHFTPIVTDAD
jgi:hypothetical protein